MRAFGRLFILALVVSISPAAAKTLPKKDAAFKKANIGKPLEQRAGPNAQVWDEFVRIAGEYEDAEVMGAIFKARMATESSGQPMAQYRFDLFSVFRANPNFFVRQTNTYFKGNLDCMVDMLVPQSGVLAFYDVENAAKNVKKPDPLLTRFMTRAREHNANMKAAKDSTLELEGCW